MKLDIDLDLSDGQKKSSRQVNRKTGTARSGTRNGSRVNDNRNNNIRENGQRNSARRKTTSGRSSANNTNNNIRRKTPRHMQEDTQYGFSTSPSINSSVIQVLKYVIPALLVVIVIAVAGNVARNGIKKAKAEKEPEETVSVNVSVNLPEDTVSVNLPEAEPEPQNIYAGTEPGKYGFYEGYEVYEDDSTGYIYDENVMSEYGVLISLEDGHIVAKKNAFERISPASMTKIMTLLIAAENISDLDAPVTITADDTNYAYSHDLSIVGFGIGETVTVRDLMYGTILPSGGDAAHALAVYVSGTEEEFAVLMNDKLAELGLSDTAHFTNCSGIYNENHYCTLVDMAMILKAAESNELCREILIARKYTTSSTPEHESGIEISNWFLRRIEDKDTHGEVCGAKTGFVNESGCCAASYAKSNDGKEYICVTVNAWSSWRCIYDHVQIYQDYLN